MRNAEYTRVCWLLSYYYFQLTFIVVIVVMSILVMRFCKYRSTLRSNYLHIRYCMVLNRMANLKIIVFSQTTIILYSACTRWW